MNRFLNVALVGGAALAVGVLPAASSAYAAVAPTPPPVTSTVIAPPITHVPAGHGPIGTPGRGLPGGHSTPGKGGPGSAGTGTVGKGSGGKGSSGKGSHSKGSHDKGSGSKGSHHKGSGSTGSGSHGSRGHGTSGHGTSGKGSHGTGSHGTGSHGHGSGRTGSTGHRPTGHRSGSHGSNGHASGGRGSAGHGKPVQQPTPANPVLPGHKSPAPRPFILGGTDATNAPWAAQVSWNSMGFECSGTVVAPQWVLTAGHCANKGGMSVRVGSTQLGGGDQVTVDQEQVDPSADLALLHLASPVNVPTVTLATADPKVGAINEIYGWGMTAPGSGPAQVLKVAKVKVRTLDCVDAAQGPAICSTRLTGSAYNGDSGGPEMAAGQEVGVCSTGDENGKSQQYASISANRTWIQQVAGV